MGSTLTGRFVGCFILVMALVLGSANSTTAQGRFEPVVQVGDQIITRHELNERTRFLALLRAPGDPRELARDQLIAAAIQNAAAADAGIDLSEDQLLAGLEEFAARANLTAEEFVTALGQNGVGAETFRDFVAAGLRWREYVRARFETEARDIPRPLIERRLTETGTEGGVRVLVSEILLPASSPQTRAASLARANDLQVIDSEEAFSAAARQFSVGGTRNSGGELPWRALDGLPPQISAVVARLSPGQMSTPVDLGEAIGLYYLRDQEVVPSGTPEALNVDYALFFPGGGTETATRVIDDVDVCDDFYGLAKGLPEDRLIRAEVAPAALPADVRAALPGLDAGDTAILNRNGAVGVLMLCGRTIDTESTIDFELVGTQVLNQKLTALASHHLEELRAQTFIQDLQN